jgi:hypothetical protein
MRRYAERVIAPSCNLCLRSENQEVAEAAAAVVSLSATLDGLEMKEQCHGKEDRFAGAMADGVSVMMWDGVEPRLTHSAWI